MLLLTRLIAVRRLFSSTFTTRGPPPCAHAESVDVERFDRLEPSYRLPSLIVDACPSIPNPHSSPKRYGLCLGLPVLRLLDFPAKQDSFFHYFPASQKRIYHK